jgi:YD repeat-containing protein
MTGSISTVGEKDNYTFTASANDKVTIRAVVTSGNMNPYLELYNPSGAKIAYSYSYSGNYTNIDKVLITGGTYTIVVYDDVNDETGNYNLTWQRLNNPCNATSITCGQTISSSLSAAAEQNFYTFTATAGDKVTIRLITTSGGMNPFLELYDSTGSRIAYNYSYSGNYTSIDKALTTGGTYTVVVYDDGNDETGNYNLTWQRLNNPCNAINICSQTISGSLSAIGEQDFYTFTANSGDDVSFNLTRTSGSFDPSLELYDSSGTRVIYQYTASGSSITINTTLSAGGIYTIIVSDYGNDETGNYTLSPQQQELVVITPNGGEIFEAGYTATITCKSKGFLCITSQEIRLSKDGGLTFPIVITTGLAGNLRSYVWNIPIDAFTAKGRIKVILTNSQGGSISDYSDANFLIVQGVPKVTRTYKYDKLNRLTGIDYEDGTKVTYTYDAVGNRITLSGVGTGELVFIDVPTPHWAYNYIIAIYNAQITRGCSQNPLKYCPEDNVTRGQMAAFIIRAKYGETFSYTTAPYFTDVPSTHTFFKYVQKLKDDGITAVSGIYGVDNYVTRGQMAAFIIRAKYGENFSYTTTPYFTDVPVTHTFFKYVQKLKDEKITTVSGTYGVDNIVTRAQMAAFLARAFLGMQ